MHLPHYRINWISLGKGLILLICIVALITPARVSAHPLGNFTVNRYSRLEVDATQIRIFYVLDLAEIPTFQAIQAIDTNKNTQVENEEAAEYLQTLLVEIEQNLALTVDGLPIDLVVEGSPELTFPEGQGGLSLLRLTFWVKGMLPVRTTDSVAVVYQDKNEPERLGWREIIVRGTPNVSIADATVSSQDKSDELRTYPNDLMESPLNLHEAKFTLQLVAGPSQDNPLNSTSTATFGSSSNDGTFADLITVPSLDPFVILGALGTAVILGALHVLEPGHGKTLAVAYLVGARATPRHAIVLGLSVTAMHTFSVFVLGLVTLFASSFIVPERVLPWLGLASGVLVIGMGINMVAQAWRERASGNLHHHNHQHLHDHEHEDGKPHSHQHVPTLTGNNPGWRGVIAAGIAGGMIPCPAALIVLLSALGLGRLGFGLLLIVAFSLGMALVLSLIGLIVLYSQRWLGGRQVDQVLVQRFPVVAPLMEWLPVVSALFVIGAGVLLLYHAVPLLRIWNL